VQHAAGTRQSLPLSRIADWHVFGLAGPAAEPVTLSSVYDSILQVWIASLPASIPARIRQQKERLSRQVAAHLVLSSYFVRRDHAYETQVEEAGHDASQAPETDLRLHSSQEEHGSSNDSRVLAFRTPLPSIAEDEVTAIPSSEPRPAAESGAALPPASTAAETPVARLSNFIRFDGKSTDSQPQSISQVLSHWQLGEDPSTYNWDATTQAAQVESQLEDMSAAKRAKLQKRAERLLRRQQREAALFEGRQTETQPLLAQETLMRSSPGPAAHSSQTQTQNEGQSQGFPFPVASQVERGAFGGRPQKKKKKARMSGF
jgi:RNA polymerase I-specific transcription initiation factor RRN6